MAYSGCRAYVSGSIRCPGVRKDNQNDKTQSQHQVTMLLHTLITLSGWSARASGMNTHMAPMRIRDAQNIR
jgi:hypothetical protein